jgi:hypothetical protein
MKLSLIAQKIDCRMIGDEVEINGLQASMKLARATLLLFQIEIISATFPLQELQPSFWGRTFRP